jgi:hypothetical protein
MRFGLRGLARGEGGTILGSHLAADAEEAGTYRSPFLKLHGPRSTRRLLDRLTAQQASLARSVALGDEEYLSRSYYEDPATGKRIAYELDRQELTDFSSSWKTEPVRCIRAMNQAIVRIPDLPRKERYVGAAVDLEILMDRQSRSGPAGRVYQGIPEYLMNGYTDMGSLSSVTERNGREKIKVDKERVRSRLVACKRRVVATEPTEELLVQYYRAVRRDIKFNERGVDKLFREYGDQSIALSKYLDMGLGVCRHLSIFYQLYLQEAGISSRLVKGDLKFYVFSGRHAWNLARVGKRIALVDVTHPNPSEPFIVWGASEEDVYQRAAGVSRSYVPTPDDQNHYKIGV